MTHIAEQNLCSGMGVGCSAQIGMLPGMMQYSLSNRAASRTG